MHLHRLSVRLVWLLRWQLLAPVLVCRRKRA
jgi:hypothetical protein